MRFQLCYASLALLSMACTAERTPDDIYGKMRQATATAAKEAPPSAGRKSCQRDWECGDGSLCIDNQCVAISDKLSACQSSRVHFDFDQSSMHSDEYPVLERISRCLKADHKMHITIDGNTDERGTLEYNLALGEKRARVVAGYLHDLGVSDKQIGTVTYGKDRPLCEEHDENCWYQNRRAGLLAKHDASSQGSVVR